ncbi:HNH endonuclease domain-containing protein [Clostridium paridis]|uniref:HNH endonuclease n=1 Tax=Clostridium paridis TaxID=2803863 RepID=A0A937FHE8_9CLOT|nr:HNH endonuclease domain-containing protein [Clostridium paridis]MBL4933203.1 HNH endonuclease [Clostridium paridis]
MSNITDLSIGAIEIKNIVPTSSKVDYRIFSRLLDEDRVVASYKMYWLLGILDEVSIGNREIEFNKIISRMIVYAWYPTMQYRLSFGSFDNLKKPINYIAFKYGYAANCDERKLLEFIYSSDDSELNKMIKELAYKVPYRLLSPFFTEELKGQKDNLKNNMITELSVEECNCLYKIIKGDKDKIIINEGWVDYLKENYGVIKYWIYYKLISFLQKRNPNVPAIAFKLEVPKSRNLTTATNLWKKIINDKKIKDIYTGKDFVVENYNFYGVLSIDHFIPWSFVLHDEMWNLIPTFKNINSKKSDKLLSLDKYLGDFCDVQYAAFTYLCDKRIGKDLESYVEGLKIDEPYKLNNYKRKQEFDKKLRECINPLYQIARNQGFEVMEKI